VEFGNLLATASAKLLVPGLPSCRALKRSEVVAEATASSSVA